MEFNFNYDSSTVNATTIGSVANLDEFKGRIEDAATLLSSMFIDPITVNITVDYGNIGSSLGASNYSLFQYSADDVKSALNKDATSTDDVTAANSFPGNSVYLTNAELKALGFASRTPGSADGTISFTDSPGLLDFSHSASMSSTSYDLFGVALHEITEVMGRRGYGRVGDTAYPGVLSQFDRNGYFTIGSESLLKFNTAPPGDDGDWDSSAPGNDPFRAYLLPGTVDTLSQTDIRLLDVIGYDRAGSGLTGNITLMDGAIYSAIGGDTIHASAGSNTVYGSDGSTVVVGSADGNSSKLYFVGNPAGAQTVTGGNGTATIFGGGHGGLLTGGKAGHNVLEAGGGAVTLTGGGSGDIFVAGTGPTEIDMQAGALAFGHTGSAIFRGAEDGTMVGGSGDTQMLAGVGTEYLFAGSGNTTLTAGSGVAVLAGSDTGKTTMQGGTGNTTYAGYAGDVSVVGGSGDETLFTGTGKMNITEGTGSDKVIFGRGDSTVQGGNGQNSYVFVDGAAGGTDIIYGFKNGHDRIELYGYAEYAASNNGANTSVSLKDGTEILLVGITNLDKSSIVS